MSPISTIVLRERILTIAPALRPHWERLRASPLGYRLARGAVWSLAGTALSRGLQLLSTIFVARLLGRETYGELGIIQNTVGMFGVFAGFAMGLTATKHVAEYRASDPMRAGRIIALTEMVTGAASLLVLLALASTSGLLAEHVLSAPKLGPLLLLGGLLIPFSALAGVQTGSLSGLEAFRTIARVNLFSGLLAFPFMLIGVGAWGVTGALIGLIASQAVNCLLNHLALRKETIRHGIVIRSENGGQDFRVIWDFSFPSVLAATVGWAANWVASVILVNQATGYAQMGIVNVGNQWRAALMFLPGLLISSAIPVLASENSKTDSQFGRALALSHKSIVLVVIPITFVLMFAASGILGLYGRGFIDGRSAFVYMLAASAVSAVSSPAGAAIIATGRMWLALALNLANASMFISLTWWLAPSRGAEGLSLGFFAGHLIQALLGYTLLRFLLPRGMYVRNLAVMVLICLASVLILRL